MFDSYEIKKRHIIHQRYTLTQKEEELTSEKIKDDAEYTSIKGYKVEQKLNATPKEWEWLGNKLQKLLGQNRNNYKPSMAQTFVQSIIICMAFHKVPLW